MRFPWESPTLGASGLGWEVWCDGMEITQFTYFQQVGGIEVKPVASEITYGLERLACLKRVENLHIACSTYACVSAYFTIRYPHAGKYAKV